MQARKHPTVAWWPRAVELWLAGCNYSQIAKQVGVGRERVRQVSGFFPERDWVEKTECVDLVSVDLLSSWCKRGHVSQSPGGLVLREEVEDYFIELVERQCEWPECTDMVGSVHPTMRFCAEHSLESVRYRYPVMTEEQKANHYLSTQAWKDSNPERASEISRRAQRAYKERRRKREAGELNESA